MLLCQLPSWAWPGKGLAPPLVLHMRRSSRLAIRGTFASTRTFEQTAKPCMA